MSLEFSSQSFRQKEELLERLVFSTQKSSPQKKTTSTRAKSSSLANIYAHLRSCLLCKIDERQLFLERLLISLYSCYVYLTSSSIFYSLLFFCQGIAQLLISVQINFELFIREPFSQYWQLTLLQFPEPIVLSFDCVCVANGNPVMYRQCCLGNLCVLMITLV